LAAGIKAIYRKVAEAAEELVSALGTIENKAIRATLADRHRVNQSFDLLGLMYPN
jgi:phosphoribosyl-ATP pyrophosphohydrolase